MSPFTHLSNTGEIVRAPNSAIRSNKVPVVSFGSISISAMSIISPVSKPSSICIMVTPVFVSPFKIA